MKFVFAKNNCLGRREFGFVISIGNIQSRELYQKHDIISKKLDQQCGLVAFVLGITEGDDDF